MRKILRFASMVLIFLAALVIAMRVSGIHIGVDAQKIAGEPACLPFTAYLWHAGMDGAPRKGDFIVISMPYTGYHVGAREGDRVIKKIAGMPGDRITIKGTEVYINGALVDRLWLAKSLDGKKPGDFDVDITLKRNQFFLMGTTKESLDSRYWGPIKSSSIIGSALPLF
jgi:conjugal transfer pilin signal peptidase TrbI